VKSDHESKEKAEKLQKLEDHYGKQFKTLKTEYDILKETNVKCKETIQQLHKELEQEHAQNVDLSSLYIRLASEYRAHVQQCVSYFMFSSLYILLTVKQLFAVRVSFYCFNYH